MSISPATDRLASPRRGQHRNMVGVLLLAVGLIAIVVAIAISSTTSGTGRVSARPAAINATRSRPAARPTGATVSGVHGGTFRDPATHALLAIGSPAAPQAEPGPGHP